jgi:Amidohydrolase
MQPTIPAPHPNPHSPLSFTPPPGACDAHCHIFGPGDRFPYSADRSYTPPDSGIDDFEKLQARLGLSNAVFVQASCHGTDNSAMLDALVRGRGRYAGVAMIDETFTDAQVQELHDAGVRSTPCPQQDRAAPAPFVVGGNRRKSEQAVRNRINMIQQLCAGDTYLNRQRIRILAASYTDLHTRGPSQPVWTEHGNQTPIDFLTEGR